MWSASGLAACEDPPPVVDSTLTISPDRATRVLIGVDGSIRQVVLELLSQARELHFELTVVDATETAVVAAGSEFDVLLLDPGLLTVDRGDPNHIQPLIAINLDPNLDTPQLRAFGADDAIGPDELDSRILERTIRHTVDMARMRTSLRDAYSDYDELTSLPSRRILAGRIEQAIGRARTEPGFRFAVLFLNIDGFKVLNESIGIEAANRVLVLLAVRVRRCVDEAQLVCRYGGDEFAILLENMPDFAEADAVAESIHRALRRPVELDDQPITVTVSVGIANGSPKYDRAYEVLSDANAACNRAKRGGKSQSSTFHAGMRVEAYNTLRMQNELRRAIERREFEVYYQPIVSLKTYELSGFEALIRWNHPKRGVVGPVEFIRLAEDAKLIIPIGDFVLRQSCAQMAAWHAQYPESNDISISVNLSGRQLSAPNLLDRIREVLDATNLDPACLKLELTESTLIDEEDNVTRLLGSLRDLGIKLYIDDFGTGYSSLSYLHRFAIDGLKIDKSFVDMLGRDSRKAAIVPSIVGLAHNLDMGVVAEGVETREQAYMLSMLECGEGQGYLFSRPVPAPQAAGLIERRVLLVMTEPPVLSPRTR